MSTQAVSIAEFLKMWIRGSFNSPSFLCSDSCATKSLAIDNDWNSIAQDSRLEAVRQTGSGDEHPRNT